MSLLTIIKFSGKTKMKFMPFISMPLVNERFIIPNHIKTRYNKMYRLYPTYQCKEKPNDSLVLITQTKLQTKWPFVSIISTLGSNKSVNSVHRISARNNKIHFVPNHICASFKQRVISAILPFEGGTNIFNKTHHISERNN